MRGLHRADVRVEDDKIGRLLRRLFAASGQQREQNAGAALQGAGHRVSSTVVSYVCYACATRVADRGSRALFLSSRALPCVAACALLIPSLPGVRTSPRGDDARHRDRERTDRGWYGRRAAQRNVRIGAIASRESGTSSRNRASRSSWQGPGARAGLHRHAQPLGRGPREGAAGRDAGRPGHHDLVLGPDGGSPWPIGAVARSAPPECRRVNVMMLVGHATVRELV